ncbi:MAG: hypothetical protein M3Z03_04620 [Actinomycetota bacterium]|nr:hypothetical protein [Actinomycetota bacterium]
MRWRAALVAAIVAVAGVPGVATAQEDEPTTTTADDPAVDEPTTTTSTTIDRASTTTTTVAPPTSTSTSPSTTSPTTPTTAPSPDRSVDLPPAPAGFADRLGALYRTLIRIVDDGAAAGAPPVTTMDPETFDRSLDRAAPADLAAIHQAVQQVDLAQVERTYREIEAVTAVVAPAARERAAGTGSESGTAAPGPTDDDPAPTTSAAAPEGDEPSATMGPVLSALVHGAGGAPSTEATNRVVASITSVPPIEPPPPPYEAIPPVEPTETMVCPDPPPGPHVGNYAINAAKVARIAINVVNEVYDSDEEIQIPLPALDAVIAIPRFEKLAIVALLDAAKIVEATLTYLRDIYWDCGSIDFYRQAKVLDNVSQHLYALMTQADGTASNINAGLITVSDQVEEIERSATSMIRLRINEALTRPLDAAPRILYMLPASEGGYLDAVPVGVQGIVTANLAAAQTAGLPVNSAAPLYLRMADQALAEGQYARAFVLYQKTYQHLGR